MGYSFLINENILNTYNDIYTAEVLDTLSSLRILIKK